MVRRLSIFCLSTALLVTACSGGSGGSADSATPIEPQRSAPEPQYAQPGQYGSIPGCTLIRGEVDAPLKLLFVNINDVAGFDAAVAAAIDGVSQVDPYRDFTRWFAYYEVSITVDAARLGCEAGTGLDCDVDVLYEIVRPTCSIPDMNAILTTAVVASTRGASAGSIINLGVTAENVMTGNFGKLFIHELSHLFGLGDLYPGSFAYDGSVKGNQSTSANSRAWRNLDGPGCPSWCNDFKPVSAYTESVTAACLRFEDRETCVNFNRDAAGGCTATSIDGIPQCCVWSDTAIEYFETNCVPFWGDENIGIDCPPGAGCYYGGNQTSFAWRPVKNAFGSIMYDYRASGFSSLETDELWYIMYCCTDAGDTDRFCEDFREDYNNYLVNSTMRKRLGSCGILPH